jgi:hypothetical protein
MIVQFAEILVKMVRQKVQEGDYYISAHAHQRMSEREIEQEKVVECIIRGEILEFQDGKNADNIRVLFQEATGKTPEIYVVVALSDQPIVVTVCRTKEEVWENVDNVLRRRRCFKDE